ncbi:ABC-type spermidine/putrescine transport system,ATPase component [Halanaeroarchaeum sp. HSR-CO]|uniref:ABC transporter ATP-binding protein n=1 Tax=Halanaeroarchaeum sp. HSR-CO TaxID=2866382 RepID=UPI00217D9883|nr:ABC transporter ATP-binding protein [Halanaeroarchaeum sp. HSR-CO]UWG46743.1 ABC-type spermidine/putrescine transport system,ATPase component [Halanaeroarchaeum sp. HSR-CO]
MTVNHAGTPRHGDLQQDRRTETSPAPRGDPVLELSGVSKQFGEERAVRDLSLSVYDGELVTLVGPSGCGKTTTLRLIAGLERPDDGTVTIDGSVVASGEGAGFVPPEERDVGVVFQEFALFPHLSAAENVAFGIDDLPEDCRRERVREMLELVGLADQADSTVDALSGGQRQRIALARSLVPEPEILLLDEPFSNLDVALRVEMREEVRRILDETGVTAISVTHDQEEALSISDRIGVMTDGTLAQVGPPERVFQHPESRFAAEFLGQASFLPAAVQEQAVETVIGQIDRGQVTGLSSAYEGTEVDVLVRPDDVGARRAEDEGNGEVVYRRYLGPSVLYRVELDAGPTVETIHNHASSLALGERVDVSVTADHELAWFPADGDAAPVSSVGTSSSQG